MKSLHRTIPVAVLVWAMTATSASAQDKGVAPPTEPWAAQTSFSEVTLVWNPAPGVTGYRISSKDFSRSVGQSLRFVAPFRGTETLQYYVQSVDSKGLMSEKVAFNPVDPVTRDAVPVKPLPPSSVTAAETSPGEITVTWSPVEGATAYFIGRSVAPEGQRTLCSLCSTATTYVDRDVKAGAEHRYSVSAIAPSGTGQRTRANPLTPSGEKGRAPIDLRAVLSSPTSITLTWKPVTGADRYTLSRSVNDGAFGTVATVTKTEYVYAINRGKPAVFRFEVLPHVPNKASAVEPGRSNRIVVDSVGDPNTPPSEVAADAPPKGGVGLRAVRTSPTAITLSWAPVRGATRYVIKLSRDGGAFVPEATVSKTGYVYPVRPDRRPTVYRFELISEGAKGEVAPPARSDTITVDSTPVPTIADIPPKGSVGLRAVRSSSTTITLTWSPVPGATQYTIKRSRDDGGFSKVATATNTEYTYPLSPLRKAEVLRFELVPEDPKGTVAEPVRSESITVEASSEATTETPAPEPRTPPRPPSREPTERE